MGKGDLRWGPLWAWARGFPGGMRAGGEAGKQGFEATRGTGEVLPEGNGERRPQRVVEEAVGDEGGEVAQDQAQPWGEVGG